MALNPALMNLVSKTKHKYAGGGIGDVEKLKDGRNTLRLIVPKPGEVSWVPESGQFWRDLGVHWIKTEENGKPIAVIGDTEICYGEPSLLNAAIDKAIVSAHDEESKKLYKDWKARKSVLINAVNRTENDKVSTFELTPTTFHKILELAELYAADDMDIFDADNGFDIVITKTGRGLNTSYDVAAAPLAPGKTFKPVTADQVRAAPDLDELIKRNYFREDEKKALMVVAQTSGITMPQLAAPETPTAALTSSSAAVSDAKETSSTPAPAPAPSQPAPATPPQSQQPSQADVLAAKRAELEALEAQLSGAAEQPAPAPAPAQEAAPQGGADASISDLPAADQDALLAELANLGN